MSVHFNVNYCHFTDTKSGFFFQNYGLMLTIFDVKLVDTLQCITPVWMDTHLKVAKGSSGVAEPRCRSVTVKVVSVVEYVTTSEQEEWS